VQLLVVQHYIGYTQDYNADKETVQKLIPAGFEPEIYSAADQLATDSTTTLLL